MAARGFWCPLETTLPPVSPVAWTTFLTGCNPGCHGIVDFFTREPGQYRLALGLYRVAGTTPPQYVSRRLVPGLPGILREAGLRGYFLWLPGTFPVEPTLGGTLAGLGVPDALGSLGISALYTSQPQAGRAAAVRDRRLVIPLDALGDNRFCAPLLGPSPAAEPALRLEVEGESLHLWLGESEGGEPLAEPVASLRPGEWTGWVRFPLQREGQPAFQVMARFSWLREREPLEVYRTAMQYPPDSTPFPLSDPEGFAAEVAGWVGTYPTLGLACDQNGFQAGILDQKSFLQDAWQTWEQRAQALVHLAGRSDWALAVGHLFVPDALQHLCWGEDARPEETVCEGYAWLDRLVARLVEALDPGVTFLMVSDHGVHPLRRRVGLNRWLHQQGYLHLREGSRGPIIDWARTQAASLGHGGIFLNVQGREPLGAVPPGAPYEALRQRLAQELLAWRDPETGEPGLARSGDGGGCGRGGLAAGGGVSGAGSGPAAGPGSGPAPWIRPGPPGHDGAGGPLCAAGASAPGEMDGRARRPLPPRRRAGGAPGGGAGHPGRGLGRGGGHGGPGPHAPGLPGDIPAGVHGRPFAEGGFRASGIGVATSRRPGFQGHET